MPQYRMTPAELQQLLAQAQALHRAGRLAEAERVYLQLAGSAPGNPDLTHLLGVLAFQQGNASGAIERYRAAISLRRDFPQAHNNLAIALKSVGRLDEAAASFAAALETKPDYAEAGYNLGILLEARGNGAEAERAYRRALDIKPDWIEPLGNLGNLLRKAGRVAEAAPYLERAAALAPSDASAVGNLALLRIDQSRLAEARTLADRASSLASDSAQWLIAAGTAARLQKDFDGAIPKFERATKFESNDASLWFELGLALEACADDEAARAALARARELAPDWERLRWTEALLLPRIPRDDAEIAEALQRFDHGLEALESTLHLDTPERRTAVLEAATSLVPFGLHYLPGDHTARQVRYADLVAKVTRAAFPDFASPPARRTKRERIRVGFISSQVQDHVVMRYFADFIVKLDPVRFERLVWSTSDVRDAVTNEIAAKVDRFTAGESTLEAIAAHVRDTALDVLVFLDAGLDPRNGALASLRLAPIQMAFYGHPVTTGFDSVDYFVSGDLLETPTSSLQYREKLVRLPGIGASVQAPPAAGDGTWIEKLRTPGKPLVICLQNLGKVPPSFDATLAEILAKTGARLVFLNRGTRLTQRFRTRIDRALEARGVPRGAIHIEPTHDRGEFLGGIARADLVLDTPGFSGGATSLDALSTGTPIVAFEGESARARQTSAMLRSLGLDELIASDDAAYVALAVALLSDQARLDSLRRRIRAGAPRLFGDTRTITALQDFLAGRIES